jgi:surface antigen
LQTQRRVWMSIQQYNVVSFVVSVCFVLVFGLGIVGGVPHTQLALIHANGADRGLCARNDRVHVVVGSDQMVSVAAYYGLLDDQLATYNHLPLTRALQINQRICVPSEEPLQQLEPTRRVDINSQRAGKGAKVIAPLALKSTILQKMEQREHPAAPAFRAMPANSVMPVDDALKRIPTGYMTHGAVAVNAGVYNAFPLGQCTWWAAQRYYELHNVFVPWTFNANAGQWVDRALDYRWHVSSIPTPGSILVLQNGVQGAAYVGHVGIVEQVNADGSVIASSMNWGNHPDAVTNSLFYPGSGVSFITQ